VVVWKRQGAALVGSLSFSDGARGKAVIVAGRDNPKGAMVVLSESGEAADPVPLPNCLDRLRPEDVVSLLSVQERAFGGSGLEPPNIP
jgi:hypothetical protein